jgi:hypothetical protein
LRRRNRLALLPPGRELSAAPPHPADDSGQHVANNSMV